MNIRLALLPLSPLYWLAVTARNWLFDIQALGETKVRIPVVCVGNVSAGGVGKTPLVEFLARKFTADGRKVAILSRGYGRKGSGYLVASNGRQRCAEIADAGDEPSELANALDGVVVAVDGNRVRGAKKIIEQFQANVILLDDGFQHRSLSRNYNIVVMTAREVLSGDPLLPAGNRREPLSALRRAHCVVITKSKDDAELQQARLRVGSRFKGGIFGVRMVLQSLTRASDQQSYELAKLAGTRTLLVSGIGQPEHFAAVLAPLKLDIVRHERFPDHHWFSAEDFRRIGRAFKESGAGLMVTTRKDAQRMTTADGLKFTGEFPVFVATVGLQFLDGEKEFLKDIESTIW